jgi:hypothetical protein
MAFILPLDNEQSRFSDGCSSSVGYFRYRHDTSVRLTNVSITSNVAQGTCAGHRGSLWLKAPMDSMRRFTTRLHVGEQHLGHAVAPASPLYWLLLGMIRGQ